ncbi:PaaI family thioesterase [Gordonia sp. TBRC 11910]|uniref:Acyl-coenzyme A thioesterase THEM4 n=1 Tax=Gordonia asplenii TaxID=2725283 RepID=A0A848KY98_9ACTN|nr:PaaI family thioesterase [Gordonia asplenii]NMO03714.1 PaaI family thioesterase [Gordonia asplenii]
MTAVAPESTDTETLTWNDAFGPTTAADDPFADLTRAVSELQEAFTRCRPDRHSALDAAAQLRRVTKQLRAQEVSEDDQLAGRLWSRPGRGQTMAPALTIDEVTDEHAVGRVTVGRFHSGRYALNGGVTPLIFDEILSRLGNSGGRAWGRTASLTVDYRSPAPLHVELTVTADVVGHDGRKRYLRGAITHADVLIAQAHGLWIATRPEYLCAPTDLIDEGGHA